MGRPALSEKTPHGTVVPRGPRTPPTTGTAPNGARTGKMPDKKQIPQKDVDPSLRRSQWLVHYQTQITQGGTHSSRTHPDRKQPKCPDSILNKRNSVGPLPRGRPRGSGWVKSSPRGVIGSHLKNKKGAVGDRIARLRSDWPARGRELDEIKHTIWPNRWTTLRDI